MSLWRKHSVCCTSVSVHYTHKCQHHSRCYLLRSCWPDTQSGFGNIGKYVGHSMIMLRTYTTPCKLLRRSNMNKPCIMWRWILLFIFSTCTTSYIWRSSLGFAFTIYSVLCCGLRVSDANKMSACNCNAKTETTGRRDIKIGKTKQYGIGNITIGADKIWNHLTVYDCSIIER